MSTVQSFLRLAEKLAPVLKNSKFKETGVLTPEEFVAAGDFLVYKCPTWQWASGDESKLRSYLPPDKQYLITRNVPCYKRVKEMEYNDDGEESIGGSASGSTDEWVATHTNAVKDNDDLQEIGSSSPKKTTSQPPAPDADDEDDIPDMEDFDLEDNLVEENDPSAVTTNEGDDTTTGDNILKTRTYDLSITYDKYYQTPRVWLFGYDEHRQPLTQAQIYEDISQDHAKKTVTMEPHPHLNMSQASIHPCKHSNVMKRIIDHLVENGKELRVDQYLVLFLKFVSAIIPTIDYDYTISMDG